MKKRNIGNMVVRFLAEHGQLPGYRLGDLYDALRLPAGTALHQRITDKRRQGFDIRTNREGNEWRYYILARERERIKKLFAAKERTDQAKATLLALCAQERAKATT